jgi:hypothetical protein
MLVSGLSHGPVVGEKIMKQHLAELTLLSLCALAAPQTFAQVTTRLQAAAEPATALSPKSVAEAPTAVASVVNVRAAKPAAPTTTTAAGSVILLADGIVANAKFAQIQPPAAGFVYER